MQPDVIPLQTRYGIARLGFLFASFTCGLMAFDAAGHTLMMFTGDRGLVHLFESEEWLWWASSGVAWSGLICSLALVGRWDTPYWRARTTALVILASIGVLLWAIRHGHRIGLLDAEAPWPWLRLQLSLGFRWAWILLLADLARRVSEHLGRNDAHRLHQVVRTLVTIGVVAWLFLVVGNLQFALGGPAMIPRRLLPLFVLQWFLFSATRAAACFAATVLALMAARECRAFLAERRRHEADF